MSLYSSSYRTDTYLRFVITLYTAEQFELPHNNRTYPYVLHLGSNDQSQKEVSAGSREAVQLAAESPKLEMRNASGAIQHGPVPIDRAVRNVPIR